MHLFRSFHHSTSPSIHQHPIQNHAQSRSSDDEDDDDDDGDNDDQGQIRDRIEELFMSPYMGFFDNNGLIGRYLKPVEEFIYSMPPPTYMMQNYTQ